VHDLLTQVVAIFLRSSPRISIATVTIVFKLTRCAPVGPATSSQPPRADGAALAIRHLVRSVRGSAFARSFRRYLQTRCAYAHLVSFSGRWKSWRTPEIGWATVGVTQADPRGLQGRQLAPYVYAGASRTSPIQILVNAILAGLNELRLLAPAALLGDLANMIDASLAKAFGVLFEAPWMEAS
jgi:hypothetical protein